MMSFFFVLFAVRTRGGWAKDEIQRLAFAEAKARGEAYEEKVSWGDHMVERCESIMGVMRRSRLIH